MYGGLIGIGVVMTQAFMEAPLRDVSAKICVVAFSAAIPLLAALVALGQGTALVGVVAGFWHIMPIAGRRAVARGWPPLTWALLPGADQFFWSVAGIDGTAVKTGS